MTVEVRLRPEAEQDLVDSANWYQNQRSGLGLEFLQEAQASGAANLYRRIQAAARSVCEYEPTSPRAQIIWQYCVLPTVNAAVANVNSPLLTELHSGHSSPAVTALNK
jgi:hypothetical protein